ncbi:MAG: hypothetical protein ACU0DI_15075 [Paracoccaceae bacterium]
MEFAVSKEIKLELGRFPDTSKKNALLEWKSALLQRIERAGKGLKNAKGIYTFCNTVRGVTKPWYVGKTCAENGFEFEIFQKDKLRHLESIKKKNGIGSLLLFPLVTPSGRLVIKVEGKVKIVKWVEDQMISLAFSQNDQLLNTKGKSRAKNVSVPGILGSQPGRRTKKAKFARNVFHG